MKIGSLPDPEFIGARIYYIYILFMKVLVLYVYMQKMNEEGLQNTAIERPWKKASRARI